jgi:hypothetical protein
LPSGFGEGGNLFDALNPSGKGAMDMVTYSDLFQYTLVLIGLAAVIAAFLNITKK